ncbi:hypothetical protein [Streptacidiphilus melanogenes]|uniref:hypothetical protein n=1 Tax=Streptacidiphilus melanogenes TaxID=411235 RepID=UPI0005AA20E5|nr:hypothetical protein [Streptacidiphilus melanogenes]
MRTISTLAGSAVVAAGLLFATPAHAATAWSHDACHRAVVRADRAEDAFQKALADLKKQIRHGGHPGKAEWAHLEDLKEVADAAAARAARLCPVAPSGTMSTGVGSTSTGANTADLAGGSALVALAGAGGVLLLRRRRASGRA